MSYSTTELRPLPTKNIKHVFVKMLRAQASARHGKLSKGDVLIVPEDEGMRWVYVARIARPATRQDFDEFQAKYRRTQQGTRRLRNQPMPVPAPEENPFEYADADGSTPSWDDNNNENDANQASQDEDDARTLGGMLDSLDQVTPNGDDEEEDVEEDGEEEEGVYDASITRGPGQSSDDSNGGRRGKRGRRR